MASQQVSELARSHISGSGPRPTCQRANLPIRHGGYIALVSLLVIAAATLAIGLSVSSLSVAETQVGGIKEQTGASFQFAEGCLDEAILRLKRDGGYPGGTLSLPAGSCTIAVVPVGARRTVTTTARVGTATRSITASVNLSGSTPTVDSWEELVTP